MKKLLTFLAIGSLWMIATANAALVDDAIARAYTKGLTRYTTNDEFGINRSIRRDEAAKFFVQFSNIIGQTNYVKDINQCQFSDVNNAISDLKETIIESCRLGIFNGANGKFYPAGNLTNAEAVAVLIRILYGRLPEISGPIWAINYYNKAEKLGAFVNIDMKEEKNIAGTRGNIIKMMYSVREMRGKGEENIRDINKWDGQITLTNDTERWLIQEVYTDPDGINKIEIDFVQIVPCTEPYCKIQIWDCADKQCEQLVPTNERNTYEHKLLNENAKLRTFPIIDTAEIIWATKNQYTYSTYNTSFEQFEKNYKNHTFSNIALFTIQDWEIIRIASPTNVIEFLVQKDCGDGKEWMGTTMDPTGYFYGCAS